MTKPHKPVWIIIADYKGGKCKNYIKIWNKYNFQIGDYYRWYADGKYYIGQVKPEDFGKDYMANFEPIEIIEEWLEKNDFTLDKEFNDADFSYKIWHFKDRRLEINTLSNTIYNGYSAEIKMYRAHMDNENYQTIGCLDVQFVHQIQHLCRDCNYTFEPKF